MANPADGMQRWPIKRLIASVRNSRKHSPEQIEQLAAIIKEFGWRVPILVDFKTSRIIAGHGRVLAARKLGMDSVPCLDGSDMSEAQQRAYTIAENRISELSSWDESILSMELADLKAIGFDVKLTGFEDDDLAKVAVKTSGVEQVEVSELQDRFWISIRGPLKFQAKALKALQKATAGIEGVDVELGTVNEF